jgi:hypothetical protein
MWLKVGAEAIERRRSERAVAIPALGWRLRLEVSHACRFATMMD